MGSLHSQGKDVLVFNELHSRTQPNFSPETGASVQHLTLGGIYVQQKEGKRYQHSTAERKKMMAID